MTASRSRLWCATCQAKTMHDADTPYAWVCERCGTTDRRRNKRMKVAAHKASAGRRREQAATLRDTHRERQRADASGDCRLTPEQIARLARCGARVV
jgi:hypothetical protein